MLTLIVKGVFDININCKFNDMFSLNDTLVIIKESISSRRN